MCPGYGPSFAASRSISALPDVDGPESEDDFASFLRRQQQKYIKATTMQKEMRLVMTTPIITAFEGNRGLGKELVPKLASSLLES